MTEQDVNRIIAKDLDDIHDTPFPAELPEWFLDNFKEIIMKMSPKDNQYFGETIERISNKKVSELTVYEGGFVCNCRVQAIPETLGVDWDTFIEQRKECDKILKGFNHMMKEQEKKLEVKKQSMLKALRPRILTPQ